MKRVFIDGSAGTTGLRLQQRLKNHQQIELISLLEQDRKNPKARQKAAQQADAVVLCLPDEAAKEAVQLYEGYQGVLLDTSTAHRTNKDWAYGLPQLGQKQKQQIQSAKKIAVPGCHACGVIALLYPLIQHGFLDNSQPIHCFSITGYSGGGKAMIEEYQNPQRNDLLNAPRMYGLTQQHKHLKEIKGITGLQEFPIFSPIVADFYNGMQVVIPLHISQIKKGSIEQIKQLYQQQYTDEIIQYQEVDSQEPFLPAMAFADKDCMKIGVYGNEQRMTLVARYDNLGKGASGAAVECLNLSLGLPHTEGLHIT